MTEREVAEAVRDWARVTLPELRSGAAYPVASKQGELPDVAAVVQRKRLAPADGGFPRAQIQAAWLRLFEVEASFMAEVGESEAEAAQAHLLLEDFGARLEVALTSDVSLGGRLPVDVEASPRATFSYEPAFVEYADGTRGRLLVLTFPVGELIEEPG